MKKILICISSLMLIILLSPIHVISDGDLELDTDTFQNSAETKSSLTDRYNIPLFTDKFSKQAEEKNKWQEQKDKQELEKLFTRQVEKEIFDENTLIKYTEEYQLFERPSKIQYYDAEPTSDYDLVISLVIICVGIILCLIVYIGAKTYYKQRKEKRTKEYLDYLE